ncbi:hypothetical protein JQK62_16550 [Leptospira santarosai]|nr:hypothetical protein [Leptospira santarosai]OLY60613.1 hypothetical protein BV917_09155 [Leptospira santarosai serovar Guaricura]
MNLKEESFVDILYRTENFGRNIRFHKLRFYDGLTDVKNGKDLCNKLGTYGHTTHYKCFTPGQCWEN